MDFEAHIMYGKQQVSFRIDKVGPGVYNAELLHYKGTNKKSPIQTITLIRGIRYWSGSSNDEFLHHLLGKAIEEHLQKLSHEEDVQKRVK